MGNAVFVVTTSCFNEVLYFLNSLFALHVILASKLCIATIFSGLQQDPTKEREDSMLQWLSFSRSWCLF